MNPISIAVSLAATLLSLAALYYARFKVSSIRVVPINPPAYGAWLEPIPGAPYPRLFIRVPLGFVNSGSRAGAVHDLRFSYPAELSHPEYRTEKMKWDGIDAPHLESPQDADNFAHPFIIDPYSSDVKICRFRAPVKPGLDLVGSYTLVLEGRLNDHREWRKLGTFRWHVSRLAFDSFHDRWFAHWNSRGELSCNPVLAQPAAGPEYISFASARTGEIAISGLRQL